MLLIVGFLMCSRFDYNDIGESGRGSWRLPFFAASLSSVPSAISDAHIILINKSKRLLMFNAAWHTGFTLLLIHCHERATNVGLIVRLEFGKAGTFQTAAGVPTRYQTAREGKPQLKHKVEFRRLSVIV
jgi:hypothetical protein